MSNPYLKLAIIAILISVSIFSCKKKSDAPTVVDSFKVSDFPLKVGNSWTYQVIDEIYNTTDTLTVSVASLQTLADGSSQYRINILDNGIIKDTGVCLLANNVLSYQGLDTASNYSYFGNFKLSMPFRDSSTWVGFYPEDTVRVVAKEDSVTFVGNKYRGTYAVKRDFFLQNHYELHQLMFVQPGIGIIRQSVDIDNGNGQQLQNFDLISYQLN